MSAESIESSKPTIGEVVSRLFEKAKQHPGVVFSIAAILFVVNPTPFLRLFRPVIRHVANKYDQLQYENTEVIVLVNRPIDRQTLASKVELKPSTSIKILDFLRYRCESTETAQVWGAFILEKIKQAQTNVVVVIGQPNVLQQAEMSLYSMDQSERHKINTISEDKMHLLVKCLNSFELKEETIQI